MQCPIKTELQYGEVYDEIASAVMEAISQGKGPNQIAAIVINIVRGARIPLRNGFDEPHVVLGVVNERCASVRHAVHIHGLKLAQGGTGCVELRLHS